MLISLEHRLLFVCVPKCASTSIETALQPYTDINLRGTPGLQVIERPEAEGYVGSSFQVLLPDWQAADVQDVVARCLARGVELKWFGADDPVAFTSKYSSWTYANPPELPKTDRVLAGLLDMRVPLTFSVEDCALIARIIRSEVSAVYQSAAA